MKNGIQRSVRNRKMVELGRVRVARAIAEGKVKVTVADLDRLIRLEEFLREDHEENRIQVVFNWTEVDKDGKVITRMEYLGRAHVDE